MSDNNIENVIDNTESSNENIETVEELIVANKKVKKHIIAKELVLEAKKLVEISHSEIQDCKLLLSEDLKEFEMAKTALKAGGLDDAQALVKELGYALVSIEEEEGFVVFEPKNDVPPIEIKDVSSGGFTGFVLSLLGGVATFIGLVYLATEKLGMTLDITKVPTKDSIESIFGWFSSLIGRPEDALNGGLIVGSAVLAVMALIYFLRVGMKGNANLRFAKQQMNETEEYITHKANCKEEMDKVDAHITEAVKVMKDYEVVLNEQSGKLKRVLHFEGKKDNSSEYNSKSLTEMKETQTLVENITRFIVTPMSEEGKLSGKSKLFLHSAKEVLQKTMAKFS